MSNLHHTCSDCDSQFTIKYDPESCPDDPTYCPFCASYILDADSDNNEDDE